MRNIITILLFMITTTMLGQISEEPTYDKTMVELINIYRKCNHKKEIKWSNDLYEISKVQIHRSDSVFRRGNKVVLKHDMRLLKKLAVAEVLAYSSADKNKRFNNRSNPFIVHRLAKGNDKLFLSFLKTYFKNLYKEVSVKTKVIKNLGNNKYILSNIKEGVYSYNGSGLYIDSIVGSNTYVRTYKRLSGKKIVLNVTNNLSDITKDKVRIAYAIMQWHFSPGHRKIILSNGKEMSARNVMNGNYLISVANVR